MPPQELALLLDRPCPAPSQSLLPGESGFSLHLTRALLGAGHRESLAPHMPASGPAVPLRPGPGSPPAVTDCGAAVGGRDQGGEIFWETVTAQNKSREMNGMKPGQQRTMGRPASRMTQSMFLNGKEMAKLGFQRHEDAACLHSSQGTRPRAKPCGQPGRLSISIRRGSPRLHLHRTRRLHGEEALQAKSLSTIVRSNKCRRRRLPFGSQGFVPSGPIVGSAELLPSVPERCAKGRASLALFHHLTVLPPLGL